MGVKVTEPEGTEVLGSGHKCLVSRTPCWGLGARGPTYGPVTTTEGELAGLGEGEGEDKDSSLALPLPLCGDTGPWMDWPGPQGACPHLYQLWFGDVCSQPAHTEFPNAPPSPAPPGGQLKNCTPPAPWEFLGSPSSTTPPRALHAFPRHHPSNPTSWVPWASFYRRGQKITEAKNLNLGWAARGAQAVNHTAYSVQRPLIR